MNEEQLRNRGLVRLGSRFFRVGIRTSKPEVVVLYQWSNGETKDAQYVIRDEKLVPATEYLHTITLDPAQACCSVGDLML